MGGSGPKGAHASSFFDELLLDVFIAHLSAYPWLLLADYLAFHTMQRDYVRCVIADRVHIARSVCFFLRVWM